MKKTLFLCILATSFVSHALAASECFIAVSNKQVLKEEGNCDEQFTPQSTFKIALSLMGFDSGIFKDEGHPEWPYRAEYGSFTNICKGPHNPKTWMRDSCVWYSQILTKKLTMDRFKNYVDEFEYGNQDVTGDPDRNNGPTQAWLSSSLKISPKEQINFLQKIINNRLPVSVKAHDLTKNIMFREELPGGWKLYGKTGMGRIVHSKLPDLTELNHGWFVGWIEKNDKIVTFASHISDDSKQEVFASFRARDNAKNKLWTIIEQLENQS